MNVKIAAMVSVVAAALMGAVAGACMHHRPPANAPACVNRAHHRCCGATNRGSRVACASLSYLLSGGVLTAASLVHLLPDSLEGLDDVVPDFPLAFFLCGLGFFVTMAFEEAGAACAAPRETAVQSEAASTRVSHVPGSPALGASLQAPVASVASRALDPESATALALAGAALHDAELDEDFGGTAEGAGSVALMHGVRIGGSGSGGAKWAIAVIVLCCLSFHSFVAGVALGVASSPGQVMDILVAVVAHKGLATSAPDHGHAQRGRLVDGTPRPGPVLLRRDAQRHRVGMAASSGLGDSPVTSGLLAFAAGTFLHVGAVEMIVHELQTISGARTGRATATGTARRKVAPRRARASRPSTPAALLAALAGFGGMSALSLWV
ncbi:hypothetical protein FNF27_02374 [Cafeteria roenbergensis]|uniref:Uncharacterized protein n=1 Tax=Cafeteria roenbergensis TaxID=33653 RepID=A0A5A8EGG0_CAFRO|nr:hypothetical protein FNF27_02374 [Cafeteria roenbergensis]